MSWNRASTWCTAVLSMPDCGGGAQGGTRELGLGLLLSGRGGERHHDSAWGAGVGAHRLLTMGPGRFAFRAAFWRYMSASAAAIRSSGAVVSLERVAMPALKLRCNSSPCQGKRVCSIESRIDWRTIADPSAIVRQSILDLIEQTRLPWQGEELHLSLSAGIATLSRETTAPEDLMAAADADMYRQKAARKANRPGPIVNNLCAPTPAPHAESW